MGVRGKTGQITVFLSIILLAVIILAGVFADASRISSGEALVKSAAASAAKSVLAGYSSRLKENYGLLAYCNAGDGELKELIKYYMEKNLQIRGKDPDKNSNKYTDKDLDKDRGIDLYGFRIENINVSAIYNFSENKVFKYQILEYMKYRAPKELIEAFVERFAAVKDLGGMSAAYSKKTGLDKILGRLDKAQQGLKKCIDGTGNTAEKFINGFNLNGVWEKALNGYISANNEMTSLEEGLVRSNEKLQRLLKEKEAEVSNNSPEAAGTGGAAGAGGAGADSSKAGDCELNEEIRVLNEGINELQVRISSLSGKINESWKSLRYSLTEDYITPNEKAVKETEKIMEAGKSAEVVIKDLEEFIENNFPDEGSVFIKTLHEDINKVRDFVLKGRKAAEMLESLDNNKIILKKVAEKLDTLKNGFAEKNNGGIDQEDLAGSIVNLAQEYGNRIEYSYEKPEKTEKVSDPRNGKAEELRKTLLQKLFDDRNFTAAGIAEDELPSWKKVVSWDFDNEDAPYTGVEMQEQSRINGVKSEGYEGDLGNIPGEADLYDEEGMFQENSLGFISRIGSLLEDGLAKLRDNIYINEYIMGMFKDQAPYIKSDGSAENSCFINRIERNTKETFFKCEVEYILHGNSSEITNKAMTNAQVFLVRLGADTLHVYTDEKKRKLSLAIAASVAGWWTGGAGIPVVSNLIMCAWGMGEAILDLKDLTAGKSVPLFKSPGDWKLDIGLSGIKGPKTDARLYFSYHDYLRLFLLAMDEDEKLGRMEDLIEINTGLKKPGFKVTGCNTFIRVEALVSMKNLFLSQPFIPNYLRTKDGRRKIRVLVYEGY